MSARLPIVLLAAAGAAALLVLPHVLSPYHLGLAIQALIFVLFAMSLDLLVGYLGLPSLGHAAYFGMGAYAAALMSLHVTRNFWLCLAGGIAGGLGIGALFGLLAVRTRGASFLMITLALGQVLWGVAYKWRPVTGGDDGLFGIPRPLLAAGADLSRLQYYHVVLLLVALGAAALAVVVRSPFGLALQGIRDGETRMTALGYPVARYKYLCFVLAAGFASVAGVLFVFFNRFVGPSDVGVVLSAKALLMVILGGAGTLGGPALGAVAITLLENLISAVTERWLIVLGALYVLVILFFPAGIVGTLLRSRKERA